MSDDQFTRLFRYMEQRFDTLEERIDAKADNAKVDRILETLDAVVASQNAMKQEMAFINHRVSRHEDWIDRAAAQLKIPYSP